MTVQNPLVFARLISAVTHLRGSELDTYQINSIASLCEQMTSKAKCEDINVLLAAMMTGRKIEAIKAYRQITGASLKESKDMVERYAYAPAPIGLPEWGPRPLSTGTDDDNPF